MKNITELQEIIYPTNELVVAYKDTFNNSAWAEWVKCKNLCWFKSTFENSPDSCPECDWIIEDFYSNDDVKWFIFNVLEKNNNKALQVINKSTAKVEWFTWWWWDYLKNINEEKLWLNKDDYKRLEEELNNLWISPDKIQFYLSEMWVVLKWRWKWLWNILFWAIQDDLKDNIDWILRTSKSSPMYFISTKMWYKKVFDYNDTDWRVILASKNI